MSWLERDTVIRGVPCKGGTRVDLHRDRVLRCTLAEHFRAFGHLFARGTELDFEERSGVLAEPTTIRGVYLPAGCVLCLLDIDLRQTYALPGGPPGEGRSRSAPLEVYGHRFDAVSQVNFPKRTILTPLVRLLAGDERLEPVDAEVELAGDADLGEIHLSAGDKLGLQRNGTLVELLVRSPTKVRGIHIPTGNVRLRRNGTLSELLLYTSHTVHGHACHGSGLCGTELIFDQEERLRRFVLEHDTRLQGKLYPAGTRIDLDASGRVRRARPSPHLQQASRSTP